MAGLGELFVREICYGVHLRDGLMRVALYEIEGIAAGFIAYTSHSIMFHREGLRNHWLYAAWILSISILRDPRRLLHLLKALRVVLSRRRERELGKDPFGECVCIAVLPEYLTQRFVRRTGLRVSRDLVAHASSYLRQKGIKRMRMMVDGWNTPALLFYHGLGAQFEPYEQAEEPMIQVWLDLDELSSGFSTKCPFKRN